MNRRSLLASASILASLLVGCASNDKTADNSQPNGTLLNGQADALNKHDAFLNEKYPPVTAQTHFAAGQFAEAEGNYPVAAQQYEKACQAQDDFLLAEYRLGVVYSHLKQWNQAVATWNKYIESTNGTASAWSNLGYTYELMG